MDKSDAWRSVAQDLSLSAAKEAVKAMRNLQAIIQCKAQICFGRSTKDNHWDWDATTSNFPEDDVSNDDNKYRYNRKGFLEDDDARSDDSIFIMDPGWDDYCLQAIKLNRPIPLCPEARRAQLCIKIFLAQWKAKTLKVYSGEAVKATTEYQEAIQATEDIEPPAVGFAKTTYYKGGLTNQVNTVIKQNNTLLYLAYKQSQKLIELEEKFDRLKQKVNTVIEKEIKLADLEDSTSSLAKRLDNFSISEGLAFSTEALCKHKQSFQLKKIKSVATDKWPGTDINEESYESLRNSGLQHIHLGIFMIRLHALHRRSARTNTLVVLRDTRWEDSRQIIATIEVDLSAGTQLVYTFPDMILSVNDFHNHVEVAIQTHGYDTWQGGESNLLIIMALTCRLSNTSYMGFQYSVENVVDHLTTNGIIAIPGERMSIEELEGMSWNLKPPEQKSVRVPSRVAVNERLNRSSEDPTNQDDQNEGQEKKWSTLGEPSGKWDYYVRYDAPLNTTPIEEVAATGCGEEFSDDEVTLGKVTILNEADEESNWDDDERSGGKNLLATRKQRSELEWENPFAAKRGEDHTVLHISKNMEKDDDDLPYPKFRKFQQLAAQIIKKHEEHAFPIAPDDAESSTSYQPPPDAIIEPAVYPPARQNPQQAYKPDYQFGNTFYGGYGEYHISQWTLPPAWTESGVMLVLPADPGLWSDVISRWESITINRLNSQTWSDNKAKLAFVENLLGESEKLMWQ
nr:TPA: orf y [Tanacetum cinerariifolium]